MQTLNRRRVLTFAGAAVAAKIIAFPDRWTRPLVDSVILPAHAQSSPPAPPAPIVVPDPPPEPICKIGELVVNAETLTFTEDGVAQDIVVSNSTPHPVENIAVRIEGMMEDMFEIVQSLPATIPGESSHTFSVQVKANQSCILRGGASNSAILKVVGTSCEQLLSSGTLLLVDCDAIAKSSLTPGVVY